MTLDDFEAGRPAKAILDLYNLLRDLQQDAFPYVPCPEGVKKRASVALILRVKPHYANWPTPSDPFLDKKPDGSQDDADRLERFFAQNWVRHGDAEALFIKRAARQGDRWQGHVALPGGRQDPGDEGDDRATAMRETWEEVGIDLSPQNAIPVGNLPQRLVTTSWGKVPLMVLCPYVFLLTRYDIPPQRLQPTEIASTHWVPLRALQQPSLRTYEYQDVSSRLAKQEFGIKKWFLAGMLGKMMFSAVRLIPSASTHCTSIEGYVPREENTASHSWVLRKLGGLRSQAVHATAVSPPLYLWGLTLGVVSDFIDLVPPYNALDLWTYPTFSPPDIRLVLWLLSYRFRAQKQRELRSGRAEAPLASVELGLEAVPNGTGSGYDKPPEGEISGLGTDAHGRMLARRRIGYSSSAVGTMLEGYYDIVRVAVATTIFLRATVGATVLWTIWHRRNRR